MHKLQIHMNVRYKVYLVTVTTDSYNYRVGTFAVVYLTFDLSKCLHLSSHLLCIGGESAFGEPFADEFKPNLVHQGQ